MGISKGEITTNTLIEDEPFRVRACVGCGYCCLKAPCLPQEIDDKGRCLHLYWNGERYRCRRIEEDHWVAQAYKGTGCSSSLNSWRKEVIYRG